MFNKTSFIVMLLSLLMTGVVYAAPSAVRVFLPEDPPQGSIPYDTEVRVKFSREVLDTHGEYDVTNKEYVAKKKQTVLVNTGIRLTSVTQNGDYCVSIRSNSPIVNMQKVVSCEKAPQTTNTQFGVDLQATAIIKLELGQKIWVTTNHLTNSNPTVY